jgi:hypothetical protein
MKRVKFIAIGRIPGECTFIHKQDLNYLKFPGFDKVIKCIAIDFESSIISDSAAISDMQNVCPHDPINSEGERQVIEDLIREILPGEQIEELNIRFERIRYQE